MKSAVFVKSGQMAIEDIQKPTIVEADDAVIRVVRLWFRPLVLPWR